MHHEKATAIYRRRRRASRVADQRNEKSQTISTSATTSRSKRFGFGVKSNILSAHDSNIRRRPKRLSNKRSASIQRVLAVRLTEIEGRCQACSPRGVERVASTRWYTCGLPPEFALQRPFFTSTLRSNLTLFLCRCPFLREICPSFPLAPLSSDFFQHGNQINDIFGLGVSRFLSISFSASSTFSSIIPSASR